MVGMKFLTLPNFVIAALAAWRLKNKSVTRAIVAAGTAAGAVLLRYAPQVACLQSTALH